LAFQWETGDEKKAAKPQHFLSLKTHIARAAVARSAVPSTRENKPTHLCNAS
jgi:hypothetical protein